MRREMLLYFIVRSVCNRVEMLVTYDVFTECSLGNVPMRAQICFPDSGTEEDVKTLISGDLNFKRLKMGLKAKTFKISKIKMREIEIRRKA